MIEKVCARCGKPFTTQWNFQKYCGVECKRAAELDCQYGKPVVKQCEYCGKEYSTRATRQRYCCAECSDNAKARERDKRCCLKTVTCVMCGKKFKTRGQNALYCPSCAAKLAYKKRQAKLQAELEAKAKAGPARFDRLINEAAELGISYGKYRALLNSGKTFEELKIKNEELKIKSWQCEEMGINY